MRTIAVCSVLACHGFPEKFPGGFIGVDIFFVISGYLISTILIRDVALDRFSIVRFYDRRVRRIFPALFLTVCAVILVGWLFLFSPEFRQLGWHVGATGLFVENLLLWSEAGYFDIASQQKPLLHIWSLAIEEQFYIFWPIFIYLARRGALPFLWVFILLAAVSFGMNLYYVGHNPVAAYYSPLGRFWELMVGALLAYIHADHPKLLSRGSQLQSIVGIGLIALALALTGPTSSFPGFWALLPTLGSFLLISAGPEAWFNRLVLASRPFVWIGLISYPLYLWHWPLMAYCHLATGGLGPLKAVVVIAVAFALATLTYLAVERPLRRAPGKHQALVLVCAMASVTAVGALAATGILKPRLSHFNAPARHEWQFLLSQSGNTDSDSVGTYTLHPERSRQVLMIGDSHLAQYAERMNRVIESDAALPGAVLELGGGCSPIPGSRVDDAQRTACWAMRDAAWQTASGGRYHTLVIGGAWAWYLLSGDYYLTEGQSRLPLASAEGRQIALARLEASIRHLVQRGTRVYLVLDNPQSAAQSPFDIRSRRTAGPDFAPNRMVRIPPEQIALNIEMARIGDRAGAHVINPFAFLCRGDMCRATDRDSMPIYKDLGHFNPDWAVQRAKFIDPVITGH